MTTYKCGVVRVSKVTFEYRNIEDHNVEMIMLKEKFRKSLTPPGQKRNLRFSQQCRFQSQDMALGIFKN
jgi:hypothetical protein